LTAPQLPLGGSHKACPLKVIRFNTAPGSRGIGQQALENTPRFPHNAVVFANFNFELNSPPLGSPSGVIGKVNNIGAFGRVESKRITFAATKQRQRRPASVRQSSRGLRPLLAKICAPANAPPNDIVADAV
jgi:hypothetical protein